MSYQFFGPTSGSTTTTFGVNSDLNLGGHKITNLGHPLEENDACNLKYVSDEISKKKGIKGDRGPAGLTGKQGLQGIRGVQGVKGDPGQKGDQVDQGQNGDKGEPGKVGATGARGFRGEKGEKGDKGDPGARGIKGAKGDKGDKGDPGPRGVKGDRGDVSRLPNISQDANFRGYKITNLGTPTQNDDASTKGYVDSANFESADSRAAPRWSGTS